MVSEREVYQSAQVMVTQHGTEAPAESRRRAARLAAAGDAGGEAVWQRIARAAEELLDRDVPPASNRH